MVLLQIQKTVDLMLWIDDIKFEKNRLMKFTLIISILLVSVISCKSKNKVNSCKLEVEDLDKLDQMIIPPKSESKVIDTLTSSLPEKEAIIE